jgi:hypothetical protein
MYPWSTYVTSIGKLKPSLSKTSGEWGRTDRLFRGVSGTKKDSHITRNFFQGFFVF